MHVNIHALPQVQVLCNMILVQAPIRYKDPATNESSVQYYIYVDLFTDERYMLQ